MIGGVYPAQAAPGQIGVGVAVPGTILGAVSGATASMAASTMRSGTTVTFAVALAPQAILLQHARTGAQIISAPTALATATSSTAALAWGAALAVDAFAALAGQPASGSGSGTTWSVLTWTATARAPGATPWAAYRPGVRTVLAAPRRLTVLARAGVERAE